MSHASRAGHQQQARLFGARRVSSGALPTEPTPVASLLSRSAERQRNPDIRAAAGRVRGPSRAVMGARDRRDDGEAEAAPFPLAALVAAREALEGLREEASPNPGPSSTTCSSAVPFSATADTVIAPVPWRRALSTRLVRACSSRRRSAGTTSGSPGATEISRSVRKRPATASRRSMTSTCSVFRRSPPCSARASRRRSSAIRVRRSVASAADSIAARSSSSERPGFEARASSVFRERERRSQLVARVGDEPPLPLEAVLESSEHRVQRLAESRDLVVGRRHGKALVE